jgi:pyruvate/2-oxoglutarate dehydrogenase complex dihydrolipoamide dehydrogenase (E3) component
MKHDIIIIGGGSAGYAAARTARDAEADVAIVDQGPLGGLCILRGCMPTKTILRSSDIMSLMRRAAEFGLRPVEAQADMAAIIARKEALIGDFAAYRIGQLHDPGFTLYQQKAVFLSPTTVQVGAQVLEASQFIIATGSVASHVPISGIDAVGYITSDEALQVQQSPKSMIVLGGGAVATELAQFFHRTGTQVTLIQRSHHILSDGDEDLARPVEARFREEGMRVFTGTQLHRFTAEGGCKTAHFTCDGEEKTASAEVVLQALGRRPNVDGLELATAGVEVDRGRVVVNAEMRTNQPHIFAVGDVNGIHEIVHIAIQQGEIAGYNAVHPQRPSHRMDDRLKAQVVFTDPQVANVGLSEKECQENDVPYLVASYPFNDHGKSLTLGETHGHVKLLCDPRTGVLVGGHIVGPEAGELIHELIAVMYFHGTVRDLAQIPHYHPTLAEIITYPAEELAEQIG